MSGERSPSAPLPRRLEGTLFPEPQKPLYFESRPEVLERTRDGLEHYEPPEVKEPAEEFRGWMQPASDDDPPTDPRT